MELKTIQHLCQLSRLKYEDEELNKVIGEMTDIVALMDTIKDFDVVYDDTKDNNSIRFSDVREDVAQPSIDTNKLISNAKTTDNCFVVPKVVD